MDILQKALQYERAEITIVALHEKKSKKYYNIYSLVELCPVGQLKSERIGDSKYSCRREKLDEYYTLFIRRVFLNDPLRGVYFFQGKGLREICDDNKADDVLCDFGDMITEPSGEEGILFNADTADKSSLQRVLPEFQGSVRVYTQFCQNESFTMLLSQTSMAKAGLFIKEVLGIALLENMEYWGSVFLCLPNLYIKRISIQLGRNGRFLLVQIRERQGKSIKGGVFEICDERTLGKGFCCRTTINTSRFVMEMPNEPEKLRYRLFTEEGDLISESANYFMKGFSLQMAIEGQKRVFKFGNRVKKVQMRSYEEISYSGNKNDDYIKRLDEEAKKRSLKKLEENRIFMYFPGKKEDQSSPERAKSVIQEIIGKAKKKCIICDPYFSREDFLNYGIMVSSTNLELHLVTSEIFLIQTLTRDAAKTQGDVLYDVLQQLKDKMKVQCHVLKGRNSSPLHDRFIITDDNAYLLGSSLSEFGSRATTLFKVPDASGLQGTARKWIYHEEPSIGLEEWIENEQMRTKEECKND